MNNKIYNNNKVIKPLFFIFFFFIWCSIDTNFENSLGIFKKASITNVILFTRSTFLPFFTFLIIFIFFINKKVDIRFFERNNVFKLIFYIFITFLLIQLISHFISGNRIIFTYYFFLSFFLIIYLYFSTNNNLLNLSFYLSLFFLISYFIFFGFLSFKHFLTNGDLHLYGTFPSVYKSILNVSSNPIRSSGLSRIAMLIYIPFYLYLLITPFSKKKFFAMFILTFILLLTQSRTTSLYWLLFIFLSSYLYLRDYKFLSYIKKISILLLLPFIITGGIISFKYYLVSNSIIITDASNDITGIKFFKKQLKFVTIDNNKDLVTSDNDEDNDEDNKKKKVVILRPIDDTNFSGRVGYWKNIINENDKYFIGNGFLGDRFLINNNASNILFYTFASGGLLASILIIFIIIRCTFTCFNLMFIKKINLRKQNIILISSIFYIAFVTFRGIAENSYAIFSIDQIIFLQSLFIVELALKDT